MYYADIGGGSLHCPVACCRRWPCYPVRHSCSPLVNTRHCLTRSAGRGAYGQRQLSCACSYFRLPNSVSSDNLGLPLGVHGRSMQGHKAFPKGDRVGAFVPDALLIASSQDALVAHPFQSSPCLSVPEIQELEDGESQRLLSKHEITIRHQLSADAALLTKRPACKERRLPLRRTVTDTAILRYPQRQSLRREIEHAAAETWLVTRLTFSLLTYLGLGYRWITKLMALGLYALCLSPGFVQIGYYYFFSKNVHRSITYGENPRNRLDLYLPDGGCKEPKKVVVFITGGAWIIGYKAWGALLAQQLVENDIIVACIDYRNFPQGSMSDMTEDITKGISFVVNNVTHFGGDPKRLYLAGQSAGAHLAAHALVQQAKKEELDGSSLTWRSSQFQAFIGISGGYNLCKLVNHFHTRGLYRSLFVSIVEGEDNLVKFSPDLEVQSPSYKDAVKHLPPMALFHGDADYSIPCDASVSFAESLRSVDADVTFRLYPDKTHTDLILQDPMRGGRDELLDDILTILHVDQLPRGRRRMVPEFLLQMARAISPF